MVLATYFDVAAGFNRVLRVRGREELRRLIDGPLPTTGWERDTRGEAKCERSSGRQEGRGEAKA